MNPTGVMQRHVWPLCSILVCATAAATLFFVQRAHPSAEPASRPDAGAAVVAASMPAQGAATLSSQQLDALTAPVALYPDALLAQVLMAATFPQDVQAAAAWSKANPGLQGDAAARAVASQPWDASVKSLVAFPQALAAMAAAPDWVQQIGNAFLAQPEDVMDSVQRLRTLAQNAGNLKSNEQQRVVVQPAPGAAPMSDQRSISTSTFTSTSTSTSPQVSRTIVIEPANPQVVYVPTYNPAVVYGTWPTPAYPPVYMPPPPGYAIATGFVSGLAFGAGIAVANALWGGCDWHGHDVNINVNRYNNINIHHRLYTNNTTANWNRSQNAVRREQLVNTGNRALQHNPNHGYDSVRQHALQSLHAHPGQNLGSHVAGRQVTARHGGVAPAGRAQHVQPDAHHSIDRSRLQARQTLQHRTGQNMTANANERLQSIRHGGNGAGANGRSALNSHVQNANLRRDTTHRVQDVDRDNALRGASDGSRTRADMQRGQQSRAAYTHPGGAQPQGDRLAGLHAPGAIAGPKEGEYRLHRH